MNEFMVQINNRHVESCGTPPVISTNQYISYFENQYQEQWFFTYLEGEWAIYGGDIGWENRITTDAGLTALVLNMPERYWVIACLTANREQEMADVVMRSWVAFDRKISSMARKKERK